MEATLKKKRTKQLQTRGPSLNDIFSEVSCILDVKEEDILSPSRKLKTVACRKIYAYVAATLTDATYNSIADAMYKDRAMMLLNYYDVESYIAIKEPYFMQYWDVFVSKSILWNKYPKVKRIKRIKRKTERK